ncbi:DedA family protein [Nocardioides sp. SYSU D00038]|uniref:DedA family protein n=1 Tax=Nocardioides sp. SYSU D00038 TaxID=2812554 RepID=UPI0027DD3036|nr:DedA family protein [Nocardioides sp. SYSU D00038]
MTAHHAALLAAAKDPDDLTGVAGWAVDVMDRLGGLGAGLLIALENLFPPLPSELILPVAGFTASRGDMALASALIWTTVGSVVGALALYGLGAAFGRDRVLAVYRRLPLIEERDFHRTEEWFDKHGRKAVFFGRMIPIFRSLISLPAGVERMPVSQFVLLTTAGSAVWNSTFVLIGYQLGEQYDKVEPVVAYLQYAVIAAVLLAMAWFVISRLRSRRFPAA